MPKKLWFKNKTYGYGWYPASKEGWLVLGGYLFLFFLTYILTLVFLKEKFIFVYFPVVFVLTVMLLVICYKTGEKPEWRWGNKK